jgi:hypothetical protein
MKKIQSKICTLRCENANDEEFENLLEEDLLDIENFLESYVVEKRDEQSVDDTIDVLRAYMPKEVNESMVNQKKVKLLNNIKSSLELVKLNLSLVSKMYWILSLLLILGGLVITIKSKLNIYTSVLTIAPIPILLGLIELIKGKDENVWELELSYKYSLKEIIFSKLIIIGAFSIGISFIMSLFLVNTYSEINLLKMINMWLIPIFITSSISLIMVSIYRSINSITLCVAIWIVQATLVSTEKIENIIGISNITLLFILAISIVTMAGSLKLFYKRTINYIDYKSYDF